MTRCSLKILSLLAARSTCIRAQSTAPPRLLPDHRVIAHHLGDRRPVRQQPKFLRRARLELAGVLHHGRADGGDAWFRNARRAAGQQVRRDREDGELRLPASGDGHH